MNAFLVEHQLGVVVFLLVLVLIALSNYRTLRRLREYPRAGRRPRVSVLVPARNEEQHIGPAVEMLLEQDYPDFEVLVLDDESTDRTWQKLEELKAEQSRETPRARGRWETEYRRQETGSGETPRHQEHQELERSGERLRVIAGNPLPKGWQGKAWACHQLSQAATGELLLFTDADTRHAPEALMRAVSALEAEAADLVSIAVRQEVKTWAEKLAVPIVSWSIIAFLPLSLAYRLKRPALTAANGQFLLFRRSSYDRLGGHKSVKESVVDDLALVRRTAKLGMKWRLLDGQDEVSCRMYRSGQEVVNGFSKNLFAAFGRRVLPYAFVWTWLTIVFLQPLVVLGLGAAGVVRSALPIHAAAAAVVDALALWALSTLKFRFPAYLVFCYPAAIGFGLFIAVRSAVLTLSGRTSWKGRSPVRTRVRWV